jgi:hypothetical protein
MYNTVNTWLSSESVALRLCLGDDLRRAWLFGWDDGPSFTTFRALAITGRHFWVGDDDPWRKAWSGNGGVVEYPGDAWKVRKARKGKIVFRDGWVQESWRHWGDGS